MNQTDILATFERIHWFLKKKLYDQEDYTLLKNELEHMAQRYISSYLPTPSDLKKYHILRKLRNNDDIILLKPDEGNGLVIMDKLAYKNTCSQSLMIPQNLNL